MSSTVSGRESQALWLALDTELMSNLQHSEGTGLVLVKAQQCQGAPQLHQSPENTQGHILKTKNKKTSSLGGVKVFLLTSPAANTQKSSEGVFIIFQQVKGQRCSHLKHIDTQTDGNKELYLYVSRSFGYILLTQNKTITS